LESDVEIGSNTSVDRGTYGATRIGQGTKIDNLVQIAHNCRIGKHNLICAHVGIAGSCTTGDYCVLAGQVGMRDHCTLGDRVVVLAQSGIVSDAESDQVLFGSPAVPRKDQSMILATIAKLPEMRKSLKQMEKQLQRLTENSQNAPT
jgi:UDP-3-O-[3-hydroxymyristoyl] glucosamine N-acyltransferase